MFLKITQLKSNSKNYNQYAMSYLKEVNSFSHKDGGLVVKFKETSQNMYIVITSYNLQL